jgi:hypothetical protein
MILALSKDNSLNRATAANNRNQATSGEPQLQICVRPHSGNFGRLFRTPLAGVPDRRHGQIQYFLTFRGSSSKARIEGFTTPENALGVNYSFACLLTYSEWAMVLSRCSLLLAAACRAERALAARLPSELTANPDKS